MEVEVVEFGLSALLGALEDEGLREIVIIKRLRTRRIECTL